MWRAAERLLDYVVGGGDQLGHVMPLIAGVDRLVDRQMDMPPVWQFLEPGHDTERAVDSDGDNGQIELLGKHERAAFELAHLSVP